MNRTPSLPETPEHTTRNAIIITSISFAAAVLLTLLAVLRTVQGTEPSIYGIVSNAGVMLLTGTAMVLARRGRPAIGVWMLTVTVCAGALVTSIFSSQVGFMLLGVAIVIPATLASLALSGSQASWAIGLGLVSGNLALLADLFGPPGRPPAAGQNTTYLVLLVLGGLLVFLIAQRFATFSTRARLMVAFAMVASIPVMILGFTSTWRARQALLASADDVLSSAAGQTADAVDSFLNTTIESLRLEAQFSAFSNLLSLSPTQRNGGVVQERALALLNILAERDPIYQTGYVLLDLDGNTVLTTNEALGANHASQVYWQLPVSNGLPYISSVLINPQTNQATLYFSAPVRDTNNNIQGVLLAAYNAQVLQFALQSSMVEQVEDQFSILVDDYGIVLAHSTEPELLLKSIAPLDDVQISNLQAARRLPNLPPAQVVVAIPDLAAGIANINNQPLIEGEFHSTQFETQDNSKSSNSTELASSRRLKYAPWFVASALSQASLLAPVDALTRSAVLWADGIILTLFLLSLVITRSISNPVIRLTQVVEEIAAGDLNVHAPDQGSDEVARLGSVFNQMTAQIRELVSSLEQRISERTRAIETSAAISLRLSTILEQEQLANEVVELLQQAFDYYHVQIYLYDDERERLVLASASGEAGRLLLASEHSIGRGRGLVGRAAETNSPVLVSDIAQAIGWLPNPLLPETHAELAVPIALGNQVLGVLDVQQEHAGGLGQNDVLLVQSVASQVAIAVRNARAYKQAQREAAQQALQSTIVNQILGTQSVADALKVTVQELGIKLEAQALQVTLLATNSADDISAESARDTGPITTGEA